MTAQCPRRERCACVGWVSLYCMHACRMRRQRSFTSPTAQSAAKRARTAQTAAERIDLTTHHRWFCAYLDGQTPPLPHPFSRWCADSCAHARVCVCMYAYIYVCTCVCVPVQGHHARACAHTCHTVLRCVCAHAYPCTPTASTFGFIIIIYSPVFYLHGHCC